MVPVTSVLVAASALLTSPSHAQETLSFSSCAELIEYIDTRQPYEQVRLAPEVYECSEPPNPSVDGLDIDFGGALLRVADHALRPGIVVGDLHSPPTRRPKDITVRNLRVEGNRANQEFECWAGPCDPAANDHPLRKQRLNGITVNGCDDCTLINVKVLGARSGGVVVVDSRRLLVDGLEAERSHFDGLAGYFTYDSVFRNVRVINNDYAGFSFDLDFSGNRIEDFESSNNRDHGLFMRYASGNTFARGVFIGNNHHGVYLDRARAADPRSCAMATRFESVTVSDSGHYAAWLNFACEGNAFVASQLINNGRGCFGGPGIEMIGRSDDTECSGVEPETTVEAGATVEQES
jgi:hypothetical protein